MVNGLRDEVSSSYRFVVNQKKIRPSNLLLCLVVLEIGHYKAPHKFTFFTLVLLS